MVMLMLIAVRTRVDTQIHPAQAYVFPRPFLCIDVSYMEPYIMHIIILLLRLVIGEFSEDM